MLTVKVIAVGASEEPIFKEGDILYLTEASDGSMRIAQHNPALASQMALAESLMIDDREILRTLAK